MPPLYTAPGAAHASSASRSTRQRRARPPACASGGESRPERLGVTAVSAPATPPGPVVCQSAYRRQGIIAVLTSDCGSDVKDHFEERRGMTTYVKMLFFICASLRVLNKRISYNYSARVKKGRHLYSLTTSTIRTSYRKRSDELAKEHLKEFSHAGCAIMHLFGYVFLQLYTLHTTIHFDIK